MPLWGTSCGESPRLQFILPAPSFRGELRRVGGAPPFKARRLRPECLYGATRNGTPPNLGLQPRRTYLLGNPALRCRGVASARPGRRPHSAVEAPDFSSSCLPRVFEGSFEGSGERRLSRRRVTANSLILGFSPGPPTCLATLRSVVGASLQRVPGRRPHLVLTLTYVAAATVYTELRSVAGDFSRVCRASLSVYPEPSEGPAFRRPCSRAACCASRAFSL
jgi:hypothetical protein